ncbi:MAG: DUF1684 domain-containing protein [Acidobacteriia bacterium]|nr:DUF1684 domain-containing protein [Terriglobia bacterium]
MLVSRVLIAGLALLLLPVDQTSYRTEIEQWRHQREEALKAEDGWLTVAGLFWLKEGENTVGSNRGNNFVLPKASTPERVGAFEFHNGVTTFQAAADVAATVNGRPTTRALLKPDSSGPPDLLSVRGLTMFVIQRGNRFGIRLKDNNSEMRRKFTGTLWFPVKEQYRVTAKYVPYDPPKKISIPNVLGGVEEETSPGYVEFTLNGQHCRLDPVNEGDGLFFIFKDQTAGKETYPSGRFLNTPLPKNGEVLLDFNRAVNPPCAFTPYATCPLPPEQNQLPVRIEAGELRYGH